jgi:acetoin utilization protein AcuB
MAELAVLPRTTVEKWQMPDPVSIVPETRASEALALMAERGIRHLPVLDAQRRVVGVLSQNDLRAALPLARELDPASEPLRARVGELRAGELMSHLPETIGIDEPLERAARRLAERHLGCLPVVDSRGRLLGIFTETDALRALVALISARGEVPGGELEALVEELRRERWRLRRRLEHQLRARRERAETQRELPTDAADRGALRSEEVLEEPLAALATRRLAALDHALARASRGRLGVCERCGGAIAPARLRVLPGSTTCAACARGTEASPRERALQPELPAAAVPGNRVHTPQGEGVLARFAAFGTCGACGEMEGRWDDERAALLCTGEGCELPLSDVEEVAVVQIGDGTISIAPELLRPVDPQPYE